MSPRYWLFKSEPTDYSFDDLIREGVAAWDGVRNFQARNYLRDQVKEGDGILLYHSNTAGAAIVGTAVVVRAGYPDHTAWDPASAHPDPRSTAQNPLWYVVDIRAVERFKVPVTLGDIKKTPELAGMLLLKTSRLSIQSVTAQEWETILQMSKGAE